MGIGSFKNNRIGESLEIFVVGVSEAVSLTEVLVHIDLRTFALIGVVSYYLNYTEIIQLTTAILTNW